MYITDMSRKKKRMGRPPKKAADMQSKRVTVNLTPAEYRRLKAEAAEKSVSLGKALVLGWRRQKGGT